LRLMCARNIKDGIRHFPKRQTTRRCKLALSNICVKKINRVSFAKVSVNKMSDESRFTGSLTSNRHNNTTCSLRCNFDLKIRKSI
uniref:Ovule protein n=1 Tax=Haemonchus placei TaxID=6290 RepID=A0A0N4W5L5_HAEPC